MMLLTLLGENASFELYPAAFTIGSGENDDILVANAAHAHVKFIYADAQIYIQSTSKPAYINGTPITHFPVELPIGAVLSLNPDAHVYYGPKEHEVPAVPTLQTPKETKEAAPVASPKMLGKLVAIGVAVIGFAGLGLSITAGLTQFSAASAPAAVAKPVDRAVPLSFIEASLGAHLLSAKQDDDGIWHVRATTYPKHEIAKADLEATGQIVLYWLDLKEIMFHVKRDLAPLLEVKGLSLEQAGFKNTLKGVATRNRQEQIAQLLAKAANAYPDSTFENQVRYVDVNFSVVSASVSKNAAFATLRRGSQTVTVYEGGQVFDVGRLKLITNNGVLIDSGGIDVFVSWRKS